MVNGVAIGNWQLAIGDGENLTAVNRPTYRRPLTGLELLIWGLGLGILGMGLDFGIGC